MTPEFRPYRARLYYRGDPRLDGAWYPVDLDWRDGGDLDTSYRRLEELWRRLLKLDRASRSEEDWYELHVEAMSNPAEQFRWVPSRPEDERRGWR